MEQRILLGKTTLTITPLGIGTWAWGDRFVWGYGGGRYGDDDLRAAFEAALEGGINFFDTAEVYGLGKSERLLGQFIREHRASVVVATKFFPFPWRWGEGAFRRALRHSLQRLGMEQVDLYQVHFPYPPVSIERWAETLADVVEEGLVRAVGVSNYNAEQMGRAYNVLARRGIPLASNQVHYSLLHRDPEFDGVMRLCKELGVTLIAYSPLEMGILTGKYTPEHPPGGLRRRRFPKTYLAAAMPVVAKLRAIGEAHDGKSAAQVALNWVICKGAVPIPGAKNARHATANAGALGWRLTADEVAALDDVAHRFRQATAG